MQIVIDIPVEEYEEIKKINGLDPDFGKAILYGTQLPEGHGRLIDADDLINATDHCRQPDLRFYVQGLVKEIPTIIEADKEVLDA